MKIKKFNEAYEAPEPKVYTAGHLMDLLRKVPIDTPIIIVNSVGYGNDYVKDNIAVVTDNIYYNEKKHSYLNQGIPKEEAEQKGYLPIKRVVCIYTD